MVQKQLSSSHFVEGLDVKTILQNFCFQIKEKMGKLIKTEMETQERNVKLRMNPQLIVNKCFGNNYT